MPLMHKTYREPSFLHRASYLYKIQNVMSVLFSHEKNFSYLALLFSMPTVFSTCALKEYSFSVEVFSIMKEVVASQYSRKRYITYVQSFTFRSQAFSVAKHHRSSINTYTYGVLPAESQ